MLTLYKAVKTTQGIDINFNKTYSLQKQQHKYTFVKKFTIESIEKIGGNIVATAR